MAHSILWVSDLPEKEKIKKDIARGLKRSSLTTTYHSQNEQLMKHNQHNLE